MSNDITATRPGGEPVTKAEFQMITNPKRFSLQSQEKSGVRSARVRPLDRAYIQMELEFAKVC
jgi:hypothetical protein